MSPALICNSQSSISPVFMKCNEWVLNVLNDAQYTACHATVKARWKWSGRSKWSQRLLTQVYQILFTSRTEDCLGNASSPLTSSKRDSMSLEAAYEVDDEIFQATSCFAQSPAIYTSTRVPDPTCTIWNIVAPSQIKHLYAQQSDQYV